MTASTGGRRRWLIIFAATLVFAVAVSGWKGWTLWNAQQPEQVDARIPVGRSITVGGSSYRVDRFVARSRFANQDRGQPAVRAPRGSELVLVTITTEILDRSVDPKKHYCTASVRDAGGHVWKTAPEMAYSIKQPEAVDCSGTADHDIRFGHPLQVGFAFLVPTTAVDGLEFDLQVTSGQDYLVAFTT